MGTVEGPQQAGKARAEGHGVQAGHGIVWMRQLSGLCWPPENTVTTATNGGRVNEVTQQVERVS